MKARKAFSLTTGLNVFLVIFILFMVFSPVLVRLVQRPGFEFVTRSWAYLGYTWMGFVFLFFSATVAADIYRLLIYLIAVSMKTDLSKILLSPRYSFFLSLSLGVMITLYGCFEAIHIRTEPVIIETTKVPKEVGRLKIVQISDVHLGLIVRGWRLRRIVNKIKAAEPDILLSTGDLVDGQMDRVLELAEQFKEIKTRYGKFAVTGNHEFYAGLTRSLDFTKKAGFTILRGEGVTILGLINIAGVDDAAGSSRFRVEEVSERELLTKLPRKKFTILLKHRPVVDKDALGLFDLQLSGHTHKGQIFPFNLISKVFFPKNSGFFSLQQGSNLYVSRGSGTWGPPIRFLSAPEVTLIELVHGDEYNGERPGP